jgi:hypothetical protein
LEIVLGKRYRVERTSGYYVERDKKGRFKNWTSIPKGIQRDQPRKAREKKEKSDYGYGHRADYPKRKT